MPKKSTLGLAAIPWLLCSLWASHADVAHARSAARDAASPRVVITSVAMHGVTQADRRALFASLHGGLSGAGLEVITPARARQALAGRASLLGCETTVCLRAIGEQLKAPLCARAVVEDTGGGTYRLAVTLTATATGRPAGQKEVHCAPCTNAEAAEALSRAAKTAGAKARATLPAAPARRVGPGDPRTDGVVPPGGNTHHDPARARAQARKLTIAGITLLAAGAAAVATGATLWALDGRITEGSCGGNLENRCIYRTGTAGIATTAVGIGAAAVGATLVILGYVRKKSARQQPSPRDTVSVSVGLGAGGGPGITLWGAF